MLEERALVFDCEGDRLIGILSLPDASTREIMRGVVIVVGGPQYRAGSHRQFTLLARRLAEEGIAVMRFDYRGMGDSEGEQRGFESVNADVRSALDAFFGAVPSLREVALCGLCDGACAAAFYAGQDTRVRGLMLFNPWVRTDQGVARTTLRHYYRTRLFSMAFWRKLASGGLRLGTVLDSALTLLRQARSGGTSDATIAPSLPERMYRHLDSFTGSMLILLSGADLTAQEFADLVKATPAWRRLLQRACVTCFELPKADHTFSLRTWHDEAATRACAWMRSW